MTPFAGAGRLTFSGRDEARRDRSPRRQKHRGQAAVAAGAGVGGGDAPDDPRVALRGHHVEGETRPVALVELEGGSEIAKAPGGGFLREEPLHQGVLDPHRRGRDAVIDFSHLVVDDDPVEFALGRPGQEQVGDGGDEVASEVGRELGAQSAGGGGAGQPAHLEGGGQGVVAEDDVGGVERLEGLGPVDVLRTHHHREVAGRENAGERELVEHLDTHVEPGAAGVEVKDQGLGAGPAHELVGVATERSGVVFVLADVGGGDEHPDAGRVDAGGFEQVAEGVHPDALVGRGGHPRAHADPLLDAPAADRDPALEGHAGVFVDAVVQKGPAVPGTLRDDVDNRILNHACPPRADLCPSRAVCLWYRPTGGSLGNAGRRGANATAFVERLGKAPPTGYPQ